MSRFAHAGAHSAHDRVGSAPQRQRFLRETGDAAQFTDEGYFGLPAFPLETVVDPTGAGDCFAGGLVGYVGAHHDDPIDHELLCRAMAYGTALASFNVEEFGVERMMRLTSDEISERVAELQRITRFVEKPIALRG